MTKKGLSDKKTCTSLSILVLVVYDLFQLRMGHGLQVL